MAGVQSLRTHLITELRDLLDAEQQLTKVLPDFATQAVTPALRTAFEHHLSQTETHIGRLREAFDFLGEPARPKRCEGMQGLIREGNSVVSSAPEGALRDAVMITAAQKVEHYEMASYGTARTYATVLGEPRVASLLQTTLEEEKTADAKLTEIAEGKVNEKAAAEWHEASVGLFEQTVTLAGKAVGAGAQTVQRAVGTIGIGKSRRQAADTPRSVDQITSPLKAASTSAVDTAGNGATSVSTRARRLVTQSSGKAAGRRKTSKKRTSARTKRTQRSKRR